MISCGHTVRGVVRRGAVATVNVHSSGTSVNTANSSIPMIDQIDSGRRVSANRMPAALVAIRDDRHGRSRSTGRVARRG